MRRAMSWVYWDPKSRTRILSCQSSIGALTVPRYTLTEINLKGGLGAINGSRLTFNEGSLPIHAIVRRFLGNDDVVHMAFAESRDRLADERGILLQLGNRLAPAIAHPGLQSSDELINDRGQRSLVRHAAFDAFRHELLWRAPALAVPIAAAPFHGADRSHAPVNLICPCLVEHRFSWRFLCSGQ